MPFGVLLCVHAPLATLRVGGAVMHPSRGIRVLLPRISGMFPFKAMVTYSSAPCTGQVLVTKNQKVIEKLSGEWSALSSFSRVRDSSSRAKSWAKLLSWGLRRFM